MTKDLPMICKFQFISYCPIKKNSTLPSNVLALDSTLLRLGGSFLDSGPQECPEQWIFGGNVPPPILTSNQERPQWQGLTLFMAGGGIHFLALLIGYTNIFETSWLFLLFKTNSLCKRIWLGLAQGVPRTISHELGENNMHIAICPLFSSRSWDIALATPWA